MHLGAEVVLDLRGFTAQRGGTGDEIAHPAECGLLPRVVALGDSATEWDHVHRLLQAAGCTASQRARLDVADGERLFQQLLHTAARRLDGGQQPLTASEVFRLAAA